MSRHSKGNICFWHWDKQNHTYCIKFCHFLKHPASLTGDDCYRDDGDKDGNDDDEDYDDDGDGDGDDDDDHDGGGCGGNAIEDDHDNEKDGDNNNKDGDYKDEVQNEGQK